MPTSSSTFADGEPADSKLDLPRVSTDKSRLAAAQRLSPARPIHTVSQLDDALSTPADATTEMLSRIGGDVIILGAGGKMGPSLARMVRRAFNSAGIDRTVIAVSRFNTDGLVAELRADGIETISGDLLNAEFVKSLPDAENVIYLAGMKFGTASDAGQTWAANVYLAGLVSNRYRSSRIVALSSGNVYGLTSVEADGGSVESDPLDPQGEYAMSVVGRERVFEHFGRANRTRIAIIRLNYATELRYGVLVDLAQMVYRNEPISLSMGYFNAIWQRDACDKILGCLEYASVPPMILNVAGAERLSCRRVCERFGELLNREVRFVGVESATALLSDARLASTLLGPPIATFEDMAQLTADWILRGGATWNKPTQFEVRDGRF